MGIAELMACSDDRGCRLLRQLLQQLFPRCRAGPQERIALPAAAVVALGEASCMQTATTVCFRHDLHYCWIIDPCTYTPGLALL